MSTSILDYVFRVLGYEYLGREDLVQIKPQGDQQMLPGIAQARALETKAAQKVSNERQQMSLSPAPDSKETARAQGFTGDACSGCGSMKMKRNGSCMVCIECGTTTGCS